MPVIFPAQPGRVIVIRDDSIKGLVSISGWTSTRAIITGVDLNRAVNCQFQETMGNVTYGYAFGERRGGIRLSGVSFSLCTDLDGDVTGIEETLSYYEDNKFGTASAPQTVIFGNGTPVGIYVGNLVDIQVSVARPELRMANFALSFVSLPR